MQRIKRRQSERLIKLKSSDINGWLNINAPPLAIVLFCFIVFFIQKGGALNFLFTPLCVIVGLFLYVRSPMHYYLTYSIWLWLLTPLVRRLVDFQSTWHATSLVMLAPIAVSGLSIITAIKFGPKLFYDRFLPFTIILGLCLWGTFIGAFMGGFGPSFYSLLTWAVPLLTAIHLCAYPTKVQGAASKMFVTMAWGGLMLGAYGLYQYFQKPEWDLQWIIDSGFNTATARGADGKYDEIRLFGTLNSPGPYAFVLGACLLAMLSINGLARWFGAIPAMASFMMSLVRSAWMGFVLGLAIIMVRGPTKIRIYLIAIMGVLVLAGLPLLTLEQFAKPFSDRVSTFTDLENDTSFKERSKFTGLMVEKVISNPLGSGMGTTGIGSKLGNSDNQLGELGIFDNGVLDVLFTFGYLGLIVLGTIAYMVYVSYRRARRSFEASVGYAIALGGVIQLIGSNVLTGVQGMFIFPMFAIALHACKTPERGQATPPGFDPGRAKRRKQAAKWLFAYK